MSEVLNKTKIDQLANEIGPENIPVLLGIFLGELTAYKERLIQLEGEELATYLASICHELKSSAASFGADRLCQFALDIDFRVKLNQDLELEKSVDFMLELIGFTYDTYQSFVQVS
ncbi:phosphorelay protein LuxU [Vibrio sp. 10N.286.49.B3]|uniref:Hpt domain-containing protein n=1 Tax=Vibrio sp. 10N.286.49.B3 TaxID=1880855 RepID=UPI000C84C684|nr:Hpt domain-containing protein [Vibrio sp. 10N.286.49.B3]PMH41927.1 phosphorelay protein LuxU [Vibrio sp. 10N.286.49.B3]